jgi:RNA polymerase sigma-70 factor (ECF subfamily)
VDSADLSHDSDEDLLLRVRRGQREAFGALVRRYQGEMFGYLKRYLGNREMAEDVFQNTFLQVYLKIKHYEQGRPARPWLYAIATNQAIDAMRRSSRHQAASLDLERDESSGGDLPQLVAMLETQGPTSLEQLQTAERAALIRASVDQLPEPFRQVLILAYYQSMKYKDIAEILEIPVGTVKSRLHAALIKLQEAWAELPAIKDA